MPLFKCKTNKFTYLWRFRYSARVYITLSETLKGIFQPMCRCIRSNYNWTTIALIIVCRLLCARRILGFIFIILGIEHNSLFILNRSNIQLIARFDYNWRYPINITVNILEVNRVNLYNENQHHTQRQFTPLDSGLYSINTPDLKCYWTVAKGTPPRLSNEFRITLIRSPMIRSISTTKQKEG